MSVAIRYTSGRTRDLILAGKEPQWVRDHPRRSYVRAGYLSVPPWQDRAELRWLDWCRRAWSSVMGHEFVLAHTIPLNHPYVCGLTVPDNFTLVPRDVNADAGNEWHPDQIELL